MIASAETQRFDPEYFKKQHLVDAAHAKSNPQQFVTFEQLNLRVDGSAFYPGIEEYYGQGYLPFLRVADVDSIIDFEGCTRIPTELCDRFNTLARVHPGDIVFTKGGSIARIGLVTREAAASRDLIFLDSSKLSEPDRIFIYLYFQTGFFNRMLVRSSSQTAQPHLTITLVRNLPVFLGSDAFKKQCLKLVQDSYAKRKQSLELQAQAEQTLLRALGLEGWQPPEPLTYTRPASEALAAKRLDSDFFAPARYATLEKLAAMPHRILSDCCASIRELLDPTKLQGIDAVRNFDVTDALKPSLDDAKEIVDVEELGSTKKIMKPGDVVISRLRSYLRQIAVVRTSKLVPTVGSTEFIVLRPHKGISPELLMVFLRSQPVQTILKYCQEGNQHPRFGESNLLEIPFPEVLLEHSEEIITHIREAHAARQQAQALLAKAKRAVEVAIEEGEAAAIKFLQQNG